MGDFNKLMDTSMAENMATVKKSSANGSTTDKVSKAHSQIDHYFQNDEKLTGHFGKK